MLHDFLTENRTELVERCQEKVGQRKSPTFSDAIPQSGIPVFVDQLIKTLTVEQSPRPLESRTVSGPAGGNPALSEVGSSAALHGRELLHQGYSIDQVVHDYGDLCQAITDLAFEKDVPIEIDEFRTLNRCLDNAIADAVTEFSYQRDSVIAENQSAELNQRLGFLAHELRNQLSTALAALSVIKSGSVALTGAAGAVLDRSLVRLGNVIDRSLAEVRMTAGMVLERRLFSVADFVAEIRVAASLEAQMHECEFAVSQVDSELALNCDRDLLASAVGNLLQNAFKFTHTGTKVTLNTYTSGDRILFDVSDHCGGLPPGAAETMFTPFTQASANRSGLGLGLSISQRSVLANDGTLSVRDVPGKGCVFTIDLPRQRFAPADVAEVAAVGLAA